MPVRILPVKEGIYEEKVDKHVGVSRYGVRTSCRL